MVRSIARGQFRVTGAWQELRPAAPGEPEMPGAEGTTPSAIPTIELALDGPEPSQESAGGTSLALEPVGPPALLPSHELALAAPTAVVELLSPPPPPTRPVISVPPTEPPAEPPTEASTTGDAGRTLAALLARMWLLRSATDAGAGVSLPGEANRPPIARAPAPPAPPSSTTSLLEPILIHAPDEDDRRPTSGLASFLVEVATAVTHPSTPPSNGHPPTVPLAPAKFRVVLRFTHCPQPMPERPASRDGCSLARYVRDPNDRLPR